VWKRTWVALQWQTFFYSEILQDGVRPFFFSFPCQSCNKRKKSDGSELQAMAKIK
jgi:hypothetical protein